ncbi:DUF192 domain-containing protein [Magnetofaba australis]|uniref:DUF192 domain-containing protein n=1 Tax=Magnetofaba australis TaxID=1472297 RepID=UPI000A19E03D|nr:DUF192 domain-containing protein [Magnetofaba australis]
MGRLQRLMWMVMLGGVLACAGAARAQETMPVRVVDPQGVTRLQAQVTLARTRAQIEHGLMDRDALEGIDGMLFLFADAKPRRFWMFHTRIPLDILFFGHDCRLRNWAVATPCKDPTGATCTLYHSRGPAQTVLELPAGAVKRAGIAVGSRLVCAPQTPCCAVSANGSPP